MEEYRVFENKIYENTGHPKTDRLILRLTIGGNWVTDYPELAAKVPSKYRYLAASNMHRDLRN